MLTAYEQHAKRKLAAIILSVAVVAGIVVFTDHIHAKSLGSTGTVIGTASQTPKASPAATAPAQTTPSTSTPAASTSVFKDGTYSASSDYYVPPGSESIGVHLTLQNDTITSISIQNSQNDRTSQLYQEDFASSYKTYVVGKKITSLRLSVIAGASDTTQGFIDALNQIATQAKA